MMPDSAMVLTGKRALDYSGGVSAEDNQGIGGYERVMGPNGQAQYFASDMRDAIRILLLPTTRTRTCRPGELFPRRAVTSDPADRDVCLFPYGARPRASRWWGTCSPTSATRAARSRSTCGASWRRRPTRTTRRMERWAGMARRRDDGRLGLPSRGLARRADRSRVAAAPAARLPAGRRPGAVDGRHAVPAVVAQDGARDQRRERQPAGRHPRQPVGVRRVAGVAAALATGVRRGDRAGRGQLQGADGLLRGLALPRRRLRRVLRTR